MDLIKLREVCGRHKDAAKEYYINPIPNIKASNARESLMIPVGEEIFALIDFTIFGSAKDSLAITENGLYWRCTGDQSPTAVPWDRFKRCAPLREQGVLWQSIDLGNGLKINLAGAGELQRNDNSVVLELMKELKALTDNMMVAKETSTTPDRLTIGLVDCEFCGKKIKPYVTFCKHCGIKLRG